MTYKIGAFGSADGNLYTIFEKAHQLGRALGERKVVVITGASTGLPNEVATEAKKAGAEIWGYSPGIDLKTQKEFLPAADTDVFDRLIFIPLDYEFAHNKQVALKYRNVSSTANCDAGIIISGRWGTLNEFTNLYDMGKIIGVLTGTEGVADELESLNKKINKPGNAVVVFDDDPRQLVQKVINELEKR